MIVVYLHAEHKIDHRVAAPGINVIEIIPSENLDGWFEKDDGFIVNLDRLHGDNKGLLDFRSKNIKHLEQLGYDDAKRVIEKELK